MLICVVEAGLINLFALLIYFIEQRKMSDYSSKKTPTSWAPNASTEARKLQSKVDNHPWKNIASGEVLLRTRGKKVSLFRPPTPEAIELRSPCNYNKKPKASSRKRLFSEEDANSAVSSLTGDSSGGASSAGEPESTMRELNRFPAAFQWLVE